MVRGAVRAARRQVRHQEVDHRSTPRRPAKPAGVAEWPGPRRASSEPPFQSCRTATARPHEATLLACRKVPPSSGSVAVGNSGPKRSSTNQRWPMGPVQAQAVRLCDADGSSAERRTLKLLEGVGIQVGRGTAQLAPNSSAGGRGGMDDRSPDPGRPQGQASVGGPGSTGPGIEPDAVQPQRGELAAPRGLASSTVTDSPASTSRRAAASPVIPPPTTATWVIGPQPGPAREPPRAAAGLPRAPIRRSGPVPLGRHRAGRHDRG